VKENVFSVVIPAYGGGELWKAAVDSVLMQDYPAIELIFADDCTPGFDIEPVRAYIEAHRRENLVRFEAVRHEKNMGTVRNFRAAHTLCTGRYLTHIAMDDAYCDGTVLSRYAAALEEKPQDVLGVYARSLVCDEALRPLGHVSFDTDMAEKMNAMTAKEQFGQIARRCCIHMGATAFVRGEFMAHGDFDTDYRLIEDWPFFLTAARRGRRFLYLPFDAIFYRNGGVTDASFASPTKKICCADHIRLHERLILPYLDLLPYRDRLQVYGKYAEDRMDMEHLLGPLSSLSAAKKLRYALTYLPAQAGLFIRRRKKLCILWLGGAAVLLAAGQGIWAIVYTAALFAAQAARKALRRVK